MSINKYELKKMQDRYNFAKAAKVGSKFYCPTCGKVLIKKTYQHIFCSNGKNGAGNCKDAYWNKIDPKKRNRKHKKSHYNKYNVGYKSAESFMARTGQCTHDDDDCSFNSIYDTFHPFEGLNDDEYKNF